MMVWPTIHNHITYMTKESAKANDERTRMHRSTSRVESAKQSSISFNSFSSTLPLASSASNCFSTYSTSNKIIIEATDTPPMHVSILP
jgi:hypothetical protein